MIGLGQLNAGPTSFGDKMYYVYEWFRMDLNLPYYVGKGKGRRAFGLNRTTKHTNNVTQYLIKNGIKRDVRILAYFESENEAFAYERDRIQFWWYLKEHNILTNQTLGGEGASGRIVSEIQKKKFGDRTRGENNCMKREDVREKNRKSQLVSQNRPEVIKKKSDSLKAKGDKHSSRNPIIQDKISQSLTFYYAHNLHHSIGTKASDDTKSKQSARMKTSRSKETDEQKRQRGERIWETRRANGTDKHVNIVNNKTLTICGHTFASQKKFADFIGMSAAYVTKCLKSDRLHALEQKYNACVSNDNMVRQ